jgi:hypothetical protein
MILGRKTLEVPEQTQSRTKSHLLDCLKVEQSSQTVESEAAHVCEEKGEPHQWQQTQTTIRNNIID